MPRKSTSCRSNQSASRNHVESWKQSGLSRAAYARSHELSYNALAYWKRRLLREKQKTGALPLVVQVPASALTQPGFPAHSTPLTQTFILRLGAYSLDIPEYFSETALMRLLDCLEQR